MDHQLDGNGARTPRRIFMSSNIDQSPKTPRARTSPTFEQLLQGDTTRWPSSTSPVLGRDVHHHDHEEYYASDHHNKKSVLMKVKEKAKKLRQSLSKKKHGHDHETGTPSWGVTLEDDDDDNDDDDEDPEYLGAPMYESEMAPESYRETIRQHPRADPVVSEKHVLASTVKHEDHHEHGRQKTIAETVSEKLAPAYAAVADATHTIASKIAGLTVTSPTETEYSDGSGMQKLDRVSETRDHHVTNIHGQQMWDKGVSVKEYLMQKLEPGEDERALSQVITEAISPRKSPRDHLGVVEKVREAVTSLLSREESSQSTTVKAANLSSISNIPLSTINAQPVSTTRATNLSSSVPAAVSTNAQQVSTTRAKINLSSISIPASTNSQVPVPAATKVTNLSPSITVNSTNAQPAVSTTCRSATKLSSSSSSSSSSSVPAVSSTNAQPDVSAIRATNLSSTSIPVLSSNTQPVAEDDNHGRILQAN